MLGSKSTYFRQDSHILEGKWVRVYNLLIAKGYSEVEIGIYEKAYQFFSLNSALFDGATIVKDLVDIPGLDLDAMLHDYHYIVYNVASSFSTKWQADWIYAKGNERKGKGKYSSFSRLVGLTIIGIGFVPYAFFSRGKVSKKQRKQINEDYKILIK